MNAVIHQLFFKFNKTEIRIRMSPAKQPVEISDDASIRFLDKQFTAECENPAALFNGITPIPDMMKDSEDDDSILAVGRNFRHEVDSDIGLGGSA